MFNKIDFENWNRKEIFYYFSKMAPTGYSITVKTDVTELVKETKERGIKFFPAYLWLITKNLNKQQEFKCAYKDEVLGYYDALTPLYAAWHDDTETFSFMWTEYNDSFNEFYGKYLENQQKYGEKHGVLSRPDVPPENAYTVSEIPWVSFEHFAVHSYENKPYFFPSVEAGKYYKEGDRYIMPLSLTCHHATTDGWHITKFIEDLENDIKVFSAISQ